MGGTILPYLKHVLNSNNIDNNMWDICKPNRKNIAQEQIEWTNKINDKFSGFPTSFQNKEVLFNFLTNKSSRCDYLYGEEVYITLGQNTTTNYTILLVLIMIVMSTIVSQTVICTSLCQPMSPWDHEESNTMICVHLKDAVEKVIEEFCKNC